jgi:hypothetical protein
MMHELNKVQDKFTNILHACAYDLLNMFIRWLGRIPGEPSRLLLVTLGNDQFPRDVQ